MASHMSGTLEKLRDMLGATAVLTGEDVSSRPAHIAAADGYGAKAIVRPKTTAQVAAILRLCHEIGQTVVPLGGNTGMAGGTMATENDIALSLERMQDIDQVDQIGRIMIVQAGIPLQKVHERADQGQEDDREQDEVKGGCVASMIGVILCFH